MTELMIEYHGLTPEEVYQFREWLRTQIGFVRCRGQRKRWEGMTWETHSDCCHPLLLGNFDPPRDPAELVGRFRRIRGLMP